MSPESESDLPSPETLRSFIQTEWADLHHSRVQEWTALGVVAGAHLVLTQFVSLLIADATLGRRHLLIALTTLLAAAFATLGILITFRHRHLMRVKLQWIFQAEERLGLVRDGGNQGIIPKEDVPTTALRWKGLYAPRPLSTSGLIAGFYALLIVLDILVAIIFWNPF